MATARKVVTIQDFVDLLPIIADRGWTMQNGYIRDRDGACPICALANEIASTVLHQIWYHAALESLGIAFEGDNDDFTITFAADCYMHQLNPKQQALREQMCVVFGL